MTLAFKEIVFGRFNRATKTVGIIYYIFGKKVMVKGATRSSESGMLYLGKSITNRIILGGFLTFLLIRYLKLVNVLAAMVSTGSSFHSLVLEGIKEL